MPTIDIDRDAAHEAAQRELGKSIYPKPSLTERLWDWLDELLYRIFAEASSVPGGWFTISLLLILLTVTVVVAIRIARRAIRTNRGAEHPLFGGQQRCSAEHRAIAEQFAAAGDWAAAIRHRLRAVARQLEEHGVLNPVPGRTATELAHAAALALPHLEDELLRVATSFNDVAYGEQPATRPAYQTVADLDDHVRFHGRATVTPAATGAADAGWAPVR